MNFSLDKIIKAIYNSNIYSDKNDLKIQIRTTLNHSKLNHFKFDIIENIKKWKLFEDAKNKKLKSLSGKKEYETLDDGEQLYSLIDKEEFTNDNNYNEYKKLSKILKVDSKGTIENKKIAFSKIGELIKKNIEDSTSNILKDLKPDVIINEHYKDINKNNETEQDIYFRHILAKDLRSSIELRKRLDIFDAKTKKLKNINSWYLHLETGPDEKNSAFNIFSHKLFKPIDINFNF